MAVLSAIAQGKNISTESAQRLCGTLGRDIDTLFDPINADISLSAKTILHHHRLISSILQTAVQWQTIFANPCERVKPPKVEATDPKYLDETQAAQLLTLLDAEDDTQFRVMVSLLLYTGFRRGELCGLEWSDIDFKNHVIHVRRSSLYLPNKGIFEDTTKNSTSLRSIKVPSTAMRMLSEYQTWQTERRLSVGDKWTTSDRLFTAWNGAPIHPDVLTSQFHRFVTASGLPPVSIHSLRHP